MERRRGHNFDQGNIFSMEQKGQKGPFWGIGTIGKGGIEGKVVRG
jgi:hypothetical protein